MKKNTQRLRLLKTAIPKLKVEIMTDHDNQTENNTNVAQEVLQPECRACLIKLNIETGIHPIFDTWSPGWDGAYSVIAEDLAKIGDIQISPTDRHSKVICKLCFNKLQAACLFASTVKKFDLILQQRFAQTLEYGNEWPQPIQVDKNINGGVFDNSMQVEIKQEVVSDEEAETNMNVFTHQEYIEPDLANLEIKIEPEEIMEQQPIKVTVNGTISYDQLNTDTSTGNIITNGSASNEMEDELKVKVKEEPLSENEELEPTKDLPLDCMLCTKTFCRVSGLKAHVIAQHSYKTVKRKSGGTDDNSPRKKQTKHVCAICRRSFSTSTDLMVHETCHNKDVCYGCNEKFDNFQELSKHRKLCTAILNKTVQKPKTLEDVKRPQFSPNIEQSMDEIKKEKEDTSVTSKEEVKKEKEDISVTSKEEVKKEKEDISVTNKVESSDSTTSIEVNVDLLKSEPVSDDSDNIPIETLEEVMEEDK